MKRTRLLLTVLVLSLTAFLTGCDELKKTQEQCERLVIYCDAGLQVVVELRQSKLLEDSAAEDILRIVTRVRDSTQIFLNRAQGYQKFDKESKADLARLFVDVTTGIRELQQAGVIHMKTPQAAQRFNRVMAGLDIAARLIQSRLRP